MQKYGNGNLFCQLRVKLLSEYRRRETPMAKTEMADTEMILQRDEQTDVLYCLSAHGGHEARIY